MESVIKNDLTMKKTLTITHGEFFYFLDNGISTIHRQSYSEIENLAKKLGYRFKSIEAKINKPIVETWEK